MKKLLKIVFLCTVFAFAVGLAACNDTGEKHIHHFSYTHDEEFHWLECNGCDEIEDKAAHNFVDGACSVCRCPDPDYAHTHTYGDWKITAPTETVEGSAVKICSTCGVDDEGHTLTVILPVLGDARYSKTADNATCISGGEVKYTITLEDETFTFPVSTPAAGHTLTGHGRIYETCTESGIRAYWECSVCGKYFSDRIGTTEIGEGEWIIPAAGHKLTAHSAVAVDCETDGNSAYWDCSVCGKYFLDESGKSEIAKSELIIPATGHTLKNYDRVDPTCTESGKEEYWECLVCGKYFSDENNKIEIKESELIIPATGHKLTAHSAVAVDCEVDGNSAYWDCSVCGKYFSDKDGKTEIEEGEWIIPATGHRFNEYWTPDMYFGHFRYSTCKHQIFEEKPHEYEGGACKVCGYDEPSFYFDEDAPEGQTGYIVIYEYGEIYADIYIPYLLGQTDPEIPFTTFYPESFFETGYDEQYGTSWQTQVYANRTYYILNFYCDFVNGSTFKIRSLAQRYEFAQTVDGSNYLVYLYQNIHETPFCEINELTNIALYKTKADGTGREYISASRTEYYVEENYIYWYCALEEGQSVERIFRIDITFDEYGKLSSATLSHVHTYGEWEITADYHAHYPTCEHYYEIIIDDHDYMDGVCSVCGFNEPKVYADADGTGAEISTFEINGEKIVRFNLNHIKDEGGLPFQNEKAAEDVIKIGDDAAYGELWETELLRFSGTPGRPLRPEVWFRIQFYWDIEGETFRLYSVGKYMELFTPNGDSGKNFGVTLYQSYYQTSFSEQFSLLDCELYLETAAGSGKYNYITPTDVTIAGDGSMIYTAVEEVDGQQIKVRYLIKFTYGTNGYASAVTVIIEA